MSGVAPVAMLMLVASGLAAISLVSVEDEIAIGRQANAQVRRELPELRDRQVTVYLQRLGQRLVRVAPGPKYPYSFAAVDDRAINAFALPGGPVWIHRGALQVATSESQVVGVLAHEIAHVAMRHAADQLTRAMMARWGLTLLGAALGNAGGARASQAAASLLGDGIFLKFSRDAEEEADDVGFQIMTDAGWDARGMVELFEILRREAKRDPEALEVFFSTHPSPQERISRLQARVARHRGGIRDSPEFRAIKARVIHLPSPRPAAPSAKPGAKPGVTSRAPL